jgi:hypothetical protein
LVEPETAAGGATPSKEKDLFGREPVGTPDWSHRRGEPRVLALVWMIMLMGVTALMFASLSDAFFVSTRITRPAARAMLLATTAGLVLFWPAVRLSQRPAPHPVRGVLQDLFVLLVPAQAVIWPHALRVLADWPFSVLTALAACTAAWALLIGGLVAMADASRGADGSGRLRWAWMLVVLAVVFLAPGYAVATGLVVVTRADVPRPGWMLSPLTSVLELTRERDTTGTLTPVSGVHWRLIGAVACVGGALLCLAGASGTARRRRVARGRGPAG